MRIIFTLFLISVSLVSYAGSNAKINFFEGRPEVAFKKAEKEGKLLFIDFYADWCKPCKQLEKRAFKNKKLIAHLNEHYVSIKINVDIVNPFFQQLLNGKLTAIPYLAFFSPNREYLGAIEGYTKAAEILDYAINIEIKLEQIEKEHIKMNQKAEAIAIDLCQNLEDFTALVIQLNTYEEETEAFEKAMIQFEEELKTAEKTLSGLDEKMGAYLNNQYFIDQFGKSLEKNCIHTYKVMQMLIK